MKVMEYIDRGQGSSDRAVEAAQNEILPKTKAVAYLRKKLKSARPTTDDIKDFVRKLPKEWHHTGLYGRRTEFFDCSSVTVESYAAWANPSDEKIAQAKAETIDRVKKFVECYGTKFVVQKQSGEKWEGLHYNSAMESMGLFVGYDADSNYRRIYSSEPEAVTAMNAWNERQQKVQSEHPEWIGFAKPLRVVTIAEDMKGATLYFSVGKRFENFGKAGEVL